MIILEGMDASGKSTLAGTLLTHLNDVGSLGYQLVHSGGPERHQGEIRERIESLPKEGRFILDRHPALSQFVYARHDRGFPPTEFTLLDVTLFLQRLPRAPTLIYCCGRAPHVMKEGESAEHAEFLQQKWDSLSAKYVTLFEGLEAAGIPVLRFDINRPPEEQEEVVRWILSAELA